MTPHAFNDDTILQQIFTDLVEKHKPTHIIETGTYHGYTTEFFTQFAGVVVIGIESNPEYATITRDRIYKNGLGPWSITNADSANELSKLMNVLNEPSNLSLKVIYFLDAHWANDQALERELEVLKRHRTKPVIMIHDWKVPGKNFGYDSYGGVDYSYDNYKPYFDAIYPEGYTHRYNEETVGYGNRGVIILEPK